MRRLLVVPVLITLALSAACGGSNSQPASSESPAVSLASPTAAVPQTGVPEIDEVIRLTLARDTGALTSLVAYSATPCYSPPLGQGESPACVEEEANNSPVQAFALNPACGITWMRWPDQIRQQFDQTLESRTVSVYATFRPLRWTHRPDIEYRVIFLSEPDPTGGHVGFWLDVSGGRIVAFERDLCAYAREYVDPEVASDFLILPPPPPSFPPGPAASLTGVDDVDNIVRLALARDIDGLTNTVGYTEMGCVRPPHGGVGSPPACEEGKPEGTRVDAFSVGVCDGMWLPPSRAKIYLSLTLPQFGGYPFELYSVFRPSSWNADYRIAFVSTESQETDRRGFFLDVTDGKVTGIWGSCGPFPRSLPTSATEEFLIPPP